MYRVLFLCTHNAARSIISEALLNHLGGGRFRAFSAGSSPRAQQQPHPLALRALSDAGVPIEGLHSKSWSVFAQPDAPQMDLIVTVCDNAAGEVCPIWPGHPATAHWGYADPSAAPGDESARRAAFDHTLAAIRARVQALVDLPDAMLDASRIQNSVRALAQPSVTP